MANNTSKKIFFYFLISHLLIWTLVPSLSNTNLPRDTIEALAWGSNLDWGFEKHPPLSAFVVEVFYKIFGSQDWAYYFLSQLFVISTFFIIWIFARSIRIYLFVVYDFYNIIFIGGSSAEGANTTSSNENTIAAQIEKILRKQNSKLNVINAGKSGYKSFDEFYKLISDTARYGGISRGKKLIDKNFDLKLSSLY